MKVVSSQWSVVGKSIFFFALCALLFALCFPVHAQQQPKIPRIGLVPVAGNPNTPGPLIESFRRGLHELGYVEGKNILIEYRYPGGEPDRISRLRDRTSATQGRCSG